jgi:glycogen debranching enzyme
MIAKQNVSSEEDKFHISSETLNYDDRTKVLNHADSFAIFDRWGDIHPHGKKAHGIFHKGTRFINRLELRINKRKPVLLSSSIKEDNDILSVDTTNPELVSCNILENTIHLARSQFIRDDVYYEEIELVNYSEADCSFDISLSFGADFRDLFEIRGLLRTLHPEKPHTRTEAGKIIFEYKGLDNIHRRSEVVFSGKLLPVIDENKAEFPVKLSPHEMRKIGYAIVFLTEEIFLSNGKKNDLQLDFTKGQNLLAEEVREIHDLFGNITTSNEQFNHWLKRSKADLVSLLTKTPHGIYPYAGVPWYNTAFGRDGIITAMEVLWIAPEVARNALLFLARIQATENIPSIDAEPGKILHEARSGEMANTGEVPFKQYYGTIDATPLFIMLAGMYYERMADTVTIKNIWPNILAALKWIDEYGDLDGDGFVEYIHKSENGLTNQGWKDSHDSVMYEDGRLCEPPIALCEVQGYVYGAKYYASRLAEVLHDEPLSEKLMQDALRIKQKFNEVFWNDATGCYSLALDGNKKPCRVVSSNAGHCFFTGIVDIKHAEALAKTLTGKNMFSGWGVRTLGTNQKRYNPMSYHNGSIWPHDNALIAAGLSKYGFHRDALKILSALFDAALFIDMQRLPELFCGFERKKNEGPVAYTVACSPQAWSVGAVFLLLQSCLQIEIDAAAKTIRFNKPHLPAYLDTIRIQNLKAGDSYFEIELAKEENEVVCKVIKQPEDWQVIIRE